MSPRAVTVSAATGPEVVAEMVTRFDAVVATTDCRHGTPEVAAERIAAEGRAADRFEGEGMELQRLVAEGYEEVARRHPDRVRVVEASGDPDEVHAAVIRELQAVGAVE